MTDTIAQRVARGIALLDAENPGWERSIDLDSLDTLESEWIAAVKDRFDTGTLSR